MIERLATLHQRAPLFGLHQTRDHARDKTKHSQPLHDEETRDGRDSDQRSDQGRADETCRTGCIDKERETGQGENDLHRNAERNIDNHARHRGRHWCAGNRGQPGSHKIAAHHRRGNQIADRFADPTHPKQTSQTRPFVSWKQDPPCGAVEIDRDQMKRRDRGNPPAHGRHGHANASRTLAN